MGHDPHDIGSADDMRQITPVMMILGAVLMVGGIMAVVYAPKMWGIERFGPDLVRASSTGQTSGNQTEAAH